MRILKGPVEAFALCTPQLHAKEMHETCASYICRKQALSQGYIHFRPPPRLRRIEYIACNRNRVTQQSTAGAGCCSSPKEREWMRRGCRAVALQRLQIEDTMATRVGIRTAAARLGVWRRGDRREGREWRFDF